MDIDTSVPLDISDFFASNSSLDDPSTLTSTNAYNYSDDLLLPLASTEYNYGPLYPTALYPPITGHFASPWEDSSALFNPTFNPFGHPFAGFPMHPNSSQSEFPLHIQPSLITPPQNNNVNFSSVLPNATPFVSLQQSNTPIFHSALPNSPKNHQQQSQNSNTLFTNVPSFKPSSFMPRKSQDYSANTNSQKRVSKSFGPTGQSTADGVFVSVYSNVQVYEFSCNNVAVMRRYDDGWINATHILKVADIDKGRRTKILEKELQGEQYEKIQGGYGRYQGTWIPLERARQLARDYGVEQALMPLFEIKGLSG